MASAWLAVIERLEAHVINKFKAVQGGVAALALALALALSAVAGTARAQTLSVQTEMRLETVVMATVTEGRAAGVSVALLRDSELVFSRSIGLADVERGAAATSTAVYRIASLTKQFTAAGILLLAEQGKLSVDDRLSLYFPEFPRADEVTLRDLLNHTSGVHNYTESEAVDRLSNTGATVPELIAAIAGQDPIYDFEPGTMWHYSNSNYALLGAVIEKVSGQT